MLSQRGGLYSSNNGVNEDDEEDDELPVSPTHIKETVASVLKKFVKKRSKSSLVGNDVGNVTPKQKKSKAPTRISSLTPPTGNRRRSRSVDIKTDLDIQNSLKSLQTQKKEKFQRRSRKSIQSMSLSSTTAESMNTPRRAKSQDDLDAHKIIRNSSKASIRGDGEERKRKVREEPSNNRSKSLRLGALRVGRSARDGELTSSRPLNASMDEKRTSPSKGEEKEKEKDKEIKGINFSFKTDGDEDEEKSNEDLIVSSRLVGSGGSDNIEYIEIETSPPPSPRGGGIARDSPSTQKKGILRMGNNKPKKDISTKLFITEEEEERIKENSSKPKIKRRVTQWIPPISDDEHQINSIKDRLAAFEEPMTARIHQGPKWSPDRTKIRSSVNLAPSEIPRGSPSKMVTSSSTPVLVYAEPKSNFAPTMPSSPIPTPIPISSLTPRSIVTFTNPTPTKPTAPEELKSSLRYDSRSTSDPKIDKSKLELRRTKSAHIGPTELKDESTESPVEKPRGILRMGHKPEKSFSGRAMIALSNEEEERLKEKQDKPRLKRRATVWIPPDYYEEKNSITTNSNNSATILEEKGEIPERVNLFIRADEEREEREREKERLKNEKEEEPNEEVLPPLTKTSGEKRRSKVLREGKVLQKNRVTSPDRPKHDTTSSPVPSPVPTPISFDTKKMKGLYANNDRISRVKKSRRASEKAFSRLIKSGQKKFNKAQATEDDNAVKFQLSDENAKPTKQPPVQVSRKPVRQRSPSIQNQSPPTSPRPKSLPASPRNPITRSQTSTPVTSPRHSPTGQRSPLRRSHISPSQQSLNPFD